MNRQADPDAATAWLVYDDRMDTLLTTVMPLAAIGYSLVYMLLGGGFFGAIVIFFVAKMFGK